MSAGLKQGVTSVKDGVECIIRKILYCLYRIVEITGGPVPHACVTLIGELVVAIFQHHTHNLSRGPPRWPLNFERSPRSYSSLINRLAWHLVNLVVELRDDSIALRYLALLSMESGLCFNSIVMVVVTIPSHMWSSLTDTPCCAQLFLLQLQLLDWSSFI